MERKINGYARDNYGVIEFVELGEPEEGTWHEATLVVGKERVFTESEVMAIVERIGRANVLPEALYSWSVHVAKEAGVSFDPA